MTRITYAITSAFVVLAIAAPGAAAMPHIDTGGTSAPAAAPPQQDRRGPDARDAAIKRGTEGVAAPGQDVRSPDARDAGSSSPLVSGPVTPDPLMQAPVDAAPVADDGGTSPLAYILPALIVGLLLAAVAYAVRTFVRSRRAHISV